MDGFSPKGADPRPAEDFLGARKLEPGIGLCLSGGGFRAMLFHVGALTRLNEAGILPKLDRVASVSGGSVAAGALAVGWARLRFDENGVATNLREEVSQPLLALAQKWVDAPAIVAGLLPFVTAAGVAARVYDRALFKGATLQDLPDRPRFTFTATSLQTGALWRFAKEYAAEYHVGQWPKPELKVADVVAASAAFPPYMSPAYVRVPPGAIEMQEGADLHEEGFKGRLRLTDGGVYDNLGLEPIWKRYETILVSDGGGPCRATRSRSQTGSPRRSASRTSPFSRGSSCGSGCFAASTGTARARSSPGASARAFRLTGRKTPSGSRLRTRSWRHRSRRGSSGFRTTCSGPSCAPATPTRTQPSGGAG